MVLAILDARHGLSFSTAEVYLNVSGGYKLSDPGADLASAEVLLTAFAEKPVSTDAVIFVVLALSGEVRPIAHVHIVRKEPIKLDYSWAFALNHIIVVQHALTIH